MFLQLIVSFNLYCHYWKLAYCIILVFYIFIIYEVTKFSHLECQHAIFQEPFCRLTLNNEGISAIWDSYWGAPSSQGPLYNKGAERTYTENNTNRLTALRYHNLYPCRLKVNSGSNFKDKQLRSLYNRLRTTFQRCY
jgi:hypothetical protein